MPLSQLILVLTQISIVVGDDLPLTLDCAEVVHAEANEELTQYTSKRDPSFTLTFARDDEIWTMVGNLGSSSIAAVDGIEAVALIEKTPWGNLNITSIEKRSSDGVFRAVHSRHSIALGQFIPSQFLLNCRGR
ncbi:MAG: hypothetical protein U5J99_12160 [Parvularculaceae bacterium]|nr:hypothetical protein [Parvularculaceae bacterium]